MNSQLALRIKCPLCQKSLMDGQHRIDGSSSVALEVSAGDHRGWIKLSPVYGSYSFDSQFPIAMNTVARFFCPRCREELRSTVVCSSCLAPMVPLLLEEGGRVFICSRRGCPKHFLEFEEADDALTRFYEAYNLGGELPRARRKSIKGTSPSENDPKEVIATGSFLQSYCPQCNHSLINKSSIAFTVVGQDGRKGDLLLSPFLNVFTNRSTVEIPHGEEVKDLLCPHCSQSLMVNPLRCERCGSRIAKITVGAMHKLITFYICLKKGCTWHGLSDGDTKLIMLEDSREW
jgi:ssDNA-binding Zn-finger/Zn-ribbon topoisomerase 1